MEPKIDTQLEWTRRTRRLPRLSLKLVKNKRFLQVLKSASFGSFRPLIPKQFRPQPKKPETNQNLTFVKENLFF